MIECAFFGTLGCDAEQKISKTGKPYFRLNLRAGDGDGAQWVSVLSFDPSAIEIADRFVRSSKIYAEGKLSLNESTNSDGVVKTGLSVMSLHARLSQIGRQKDRKLAKEHHSGRSAPANRLEKPVEKGSGGEFYSDGIPFNSGWR